MSPRRCVSDAEAFALSDHTASEFLRYSRYFGVIPAPTNSDVDGTSVYQALGKYPSKTLACDAPTYILHPTYGWLPSGTPYLALLAARRVVS
jgi:hypothetical protein